MKKHLIIFIIVFAISLTGCSNSFEPILLDSSKSVKNSAILNIQQACTSRNPYIRTYAMEGLVQIGDSTADNLIVRSLKDTTNAVRCAAAIAAGDRKITAAKDQLEKMIATNDIMTKLSAGYALEKLGDNRFLHWYDKALQSNIDRYAGQSCLLLGKLGKSGLRKNSIRQLRNVMEKPGQKPYIRLQAAEALARLGDSSIKERLLDFAGSGYADDRLLTVSALKLLGSPECYAMLSVLAYDDQLEVKLSALRALGTLAGKDDIAPAYQALEYQDPFNDASTTQRVKHLALLAIGSFGRNGDASIFKEYLNSKDDMLKLTAAIAVLEWDRIRATIVAN